MTYEETNAEIAANTSEKKITMQDVMSGQATLDDLVGQLTIPEMAELCVGTSRGNMGGDTAIIGSSSPQLYRGGGRHHFPMIEDRDIRNLVLADGPAGLRLSKHFKADAEGNVIPGTSDAPIPGMDLLMAGSPKPEIPEDAIDYYQYCTAIPIATLLCPDMGCGCNQRMWRYCRGRDERIRCDTVAGTGDEYSQKSVVRT